MCVMRASCFGKKSAGADGVLRWPGIVVAVSSVLILAAPAGGQEAANVAALSGTLKKLAEEMRAAGYLRPVGLSANRAGAHPGTHEIGFDSAADTITLRHTARSREGFAHGALRAARWIAGKKGFFEFKEILGELG